MNTIKDRILIIENNPEISDFLANQALTSNSYQVFQVADSSSAINKAIQINPDLIISNINVPGLSGKDLIIALSSHGITSPTIMLAMQGQESEIIQAFRLGAADYLTWPVRETEVVMVVDRLLKQVHDSREHKNLENQLRLTNQQLQQRVKELTAVFTIGKVVTSVTNHKLLFDKILQISAQVCQSDLGWLLIRQEEKEKHFLLAAQTNLPDVFNTKLHNIWDDGISSLVAVSGETLNIAGDPIRRFKVKVFGDSIIIVPIKIQRQVMGLLVLMRKQPKPYSKSEQRLLESVAEYASIALVNAKLFRSFETRDQVLSKLVKQTQNNEKILNELLKKTKTNLMDMTANTEKSWTVFKKLIEEKIDPESLPALEDFEMNLQENQRLASIINKASFLQKSYQKNEFDLIAMIEEIKSNFLPSIQANNLELTTHTPTNSIKIIADPHQIYEVLQGIISNAIQFCEPRGSIQIRIAHETTTTVNVSISNTGTIPDNIKDTLFIEATMDKQNKKRFGGIGISTQLINRLVLQNNGKIWAENNPDDGSIIHLLLPVTE